ncbi:MAG TPA: RCC1 domain-containing protein, partial [Jatrophihabitantaceae bacterium]
MTRRPAAKRPAPRVERSGRRGWMLAAVAVVLVGAAVVALVVAWPGRRAAATARAISIAAGLSHTCAILDDHTVRCWGTNLGGELGDGTRTDRLTPVRVLGL